MHPCRVGTTQLHTLLTRICDGDASLEDLDQLERLSDMVKHTSLCGLGQSAPTRCCRPCATSTAHSDRLAAYRRTIVEMLFLERNHICSVCVANNHCELQDLAAGLGLTHFELPAVNPRVGIDASHPLFAIDHNRCVMCTRYVRVCDEVEGAHTWDVMGRGIDARVVTDLHPLGGVADLHQLRQVRPGVPDRGAVREGPLGRRRGQDPRADLVGALLGGPDICSPRVRSTAGVNREEGIGVAEAPGGTLPHHYRVDRDGIVAWANLVIATGHNNLAMNRSVAQVARHYVKADRLTEPMLNRVEAVIRCYDPCLSCSTHAIGQMPLHLQLLAADGAVLDERRR